MLPSPQRLASAALARATFWRVIDVIARHFVAAFAAEQQGVAALGVFASRYDFHVRWVNTVRGVAQVVYGHIPRNFAMFKFVCEAVGHGNSGGSLGYNETAIPGFEFASHPKPTIIGFVNVAPKPFFKRNEPDSPRYAVPPDSHVVLAA